MLSLRRLFLGPRGGGGAFRLNNKCIKPIQRMASGLATLLQFGDKLMRRIGILRERMFQRAANRARLPIVQNYAELQGMWIGRRFGQFTKAHGVGAIGRLLNASVAQSLQLLRHTDGKLCAICDDPVGFRQSLCSARIIRRRPPQRPQNSNLCADLRNFLRCAFFIERRQRLLAFGDLRRERIAFGAILRIRRHARC